MNNFRNSLLLTTFFVLDEDTVSKNLILYLDEHVSRNEVITPDSMMSVCLMCWAEDTKRASMPTEEEKQAIKDAFTNALKFAWSHNKSYLTRVAKLQRNRMRGWRISDSHHRRRSKQQCEVADNVQ